MDKTADVELAPPRLRRAQPLRIVGLGATLLLAGAGLGWALTTVFSPPKAVLNSAGYTFAEVVTSEVGSSINLNVVAGWTSTSVGSNLATGVVTTVNVVPGQQVGPGATLYTVNLRPVVVAQGDIPSFQDLSVGATGKDVAQLQKLLATLGFYNFEVDGNFDWATRQAVESWQESLGLDADGVVFSRDIIYVPTLPMRVSLDVAKIQRGASLSGGERVVEGLPSTPSFKIPVTENQASLMPLGTRVEITGPGGDLWEAFVTDEEADDQTGITLTLDGMDGGSICADACNTVPVTGEALLRSRIVTVEAVIGLTVPSAALLSTTDGSVAVIDEDGIAHPVQVVASARGMSVIKGVRAGLLVRVPAMVQ